MARDMNTQNVPADGAISRALAEAAVGWRWADLPGAVRHETKRCLVNFFACALAGWRDPAVTTAAGLFERIGPAGDFTVIGSGRGASMLHAASLNAMAANVFDFDDTHMPTIAHPTAPVAPVALALAQAGRISGSEMLEAVAVGIELQCRIALAISPGHYARGWHITSTCGVFGAAAAAARLLGLDARRTVWAFGSAASQAGGLVETLGTMAKSIGVGNAASNGLLSALLAQEGFAGPESPLEGARGFLRVFGPEVNWGALTDDMGQRWEILANTYKPYPCGVVLNPVIEACLALRPAVVDDLAGIRRVELRAHPLLRQRTDRPGVTSGKTSQVSAQHAVAVSLVRGRAGLAEFSDEAVRDAALRPLNERLVFVEDASLGVEAAEVALSMADGRRIVHRVDAAHGSLASPLSDDELSAKCRELARYGESGVAVEPLLQALWNLDREPDAARALFNTSEA
jgi:2-methylcitrate dehydratase PrpD